MIKHERLLAKHGKLVGKDNKLYDKFNKLILNGVSGLLDSIPSWLYYPEGAMRLRLFGQLILTKLIEEAALAGFEVVSANTDGIEVLVEHNRMQEYYDLVEVVQKQFDVVFEHENYKSIAYWSVNDYIAVLDLPEDKISPNDLAIKGNIKQKGHMVTEPLLGKSVNNLIIPKALNIYFIYNVPVEETIKSEKDIYLFCSSPKADKTYTVLWKGEKQQRLNRFFISSNGAYLYKQKVGQNLNHMMKGFTVELLNNCKDRNAHSYDINYGYYISKCKELIDLVEPKQLSLF